MVLLGVKKIKSKIFYNHSLRIEQGFSFFIIRQAFFNMKIYNQLFRRDFERFLDVKYTVMEMQLGLYFEG